MARLSKDEIRAEIEAKGFKPIAIDGYTNLDSAIEVECKHGHKIETNMKSIRHPSFECPFCAASSFTIEQPRGVPEKNGYRIIAFDNATEKMGMSIYDNGKLVYFDLFKFTDGILVQRLVKIQRLVEEVVIPIWKPDFIVYEDIQQQGPNVLTFKILSMLLGILEVAAAKNGIAYDTVLAKVWRSGVGINGKTRVEEKKAAIEKVRQLTGLTVPEDTAEAILIGKYAALNKRPKAF